MNVTLPRFHARGIEVANDVGVRVHLIQARDDGAKNFYKPDDFIEPPVDPLKIAVGFGRKARKTISSRILTQFPLRHQGRSYSGTMFPTQHLADFHHLLPLNYAPQSKSIASPAPPPRQGVAVDASGEFSDRRYRHPIGELAGASSSRLLEGCS